jgi:hypothetical protein
MIASRNNRVPSHTFLGGHQERVDVLKSFELGLVDLLDNVTEEKKNQNEGLGKGKKSIG